MKALITGVSGFLGSNLAQRLLEEGHDVIGIDDFSTGFKENIVEFDGNPHFDFIEGDITDARVLAEAHGVEGVVHLAARKIPRYGGALETLDINYRGTRSVLDYAAGRGCKVVVASTSDVYGRNPDLPFNESTSNLVIGSSKSPRWAYAASKLFDEHLALAYSDEHGFPVSILRFFGSYGPKENPSWWGGPQSVFIMACLRGESLTIHGDGMQTRTFTYVDDTIEGIYRALVSDAANGEILNIGGTEETPIVDLARLVHELCETGDPIQIEYIPYESFSDKPYEDVMRRVPDVQLAESLLGFRARVGLKEGLTATIRWHKSELM